MTADEQSLHDLTREMQDAWNAADAAGFVAHFLEDCTFIHIYGGQIDGRRAVEEAHREIFNGVYKGSRNLYTVRSVRFPRPDVAIVLVEAHLRFQADGQPREIKARPTLFAVKEAGRWVLEMFQNTQISEMPGGNGPAPPRIGN
jgi:uncharacterized protein (TIGR02246 family)